VAAVTSTAERAGPDGRTARRDRNRNAVLDAVLALFAEGNLDPSPDEVARRSGVSLRSVYRYVTDRDDLVRSAIDRQQEKVRPLFAIDRVGEGSLAERVDAFVTARLRGYEAAAATARASRLRMATNEIIREQLEAGRRAMRAQLELQFAAELDALDHRRRRAVVAAADALTQIETLDLYRVHQGLSAAVTHDVLTVALLALLGAPSGQS